MDIAPLGFYVDTSGLSNALGPVDAFTQQTMKAADAADKLGDKATEAAAKASGAGAGLGRMGAEAGNAAAKQDMLGAKTQSATQRFQDFIGKLTQARTGMQQGGQAAGGFVGKLGAANSAIQGATEKANMMAQALGVSGNVGLQGIMGRAAVGAGRFGSIIMGVGRALGPVGIAISGVTAGLVSMQFALADNQDRWNQYRQRLAVALKDQDEANASVQRLTDIANNVGVSMDAVMRSFQRFANVKETLGATTEELEQMTQAIVQIGQVAGTSQGEMQGAMLQFSQALAAGRLNGDELRSIMESMQPLLQEIAIGMGVSVGELRKMGAEGELTSNRIFDALMSRTDEIEERFQELDGTSAQAQQRMANQWDLLMANVGEFMNSSEMVQGIYNNIAMSIGVINDFLSDAPGDADAIEERMARKAAAIPQLAGIPLFGPSAAAATAYSLFGDREDLEEARAAGGKTFEQTMREMTGTQGRLETQVKTITGEYAKQLGQLNQMNSAALNIADNMEIARELEVEATANLAQAQARYDSQFRQRTVLTKLANEGNEEAREALEAMREDIVTAELALESAVKAQGELENARRQLERRQADVASGGLTKIQRETDRLNEAMLRGAGAYVGLWTQAAEMAERAREAGTAMSDEAAFRILTTQQRSAAFQRIGDIGAQADLQAQIAQMMAGGGNDFEIEARTEAMSMAFNQFGSALSDNMDIVDGFTAALIRMKAAQQAVADQAEIDAINRNIASTQAQIGAVGRGSYAEAEAAFEAEMMELMRERGQMSEALRGAGSGVTDGVGATDAVAALIRSAFGENSITSMSRPGARTSSGRLSDHALGRAIDFVPEGGMEGSNPERVLAQLQAMGVPIRTNANGTLQFFGPGQFNVDGRHDDHYHVGLAQGASPSGMAEGYDPTQFDQATQDLISARRRQFAVDQQLNATALITGSRRSVGQNTRRLDTVGDPLAREELENRIAIEEALERVPEAFRPILRDAMELDQLVARELRMREDLEGMTRGNDERARMLEAMGDPAALRQLELEIRLENIRRNNPAGATRDAMEREAREGFDMDTQEALDRGRLERQERLRSMQQQLILSQYMGEELAVQERIMERANQLRADGVETDSLAYEQALELEESLARQDQLLERQLRNRLAFRDAYLDAAREIGDGFAKMFSYAFREGELKANFALRAIELAFYNMLDRIVEQLVISPLVNIIGQIFGNLLGGILGPVPGLTSGGGGGGGNPLGRPGGGYALGGVIPAANGYIVNTPTRLRGGSVLAGEGSGMYEAILPLKRGPNGALGVQAAGMGGGGGGSTQVNIIDQRGTRDSEAVQVQERETGNGLREIEVLIRDTTRANIRSGAFDADNRASYGLGRTVTRR